MTGLHYQLREEKPTEKYRVFKVRRSNETHFTTVWFDGKTHCGSCVGKTFVMQRMCPHGKAVRRYLGIYGSKRAGPSRKGRITA